MIQIYHAYKIQTLDDVLFKTQITPQESHKISGIVSIVVTCCF